MRFITALLLLFSPLVALAQSTGIGAFPAATCIPRETWVDTDETDDTNCTTTSDNALCVCVAVNTWVANEVGGGAGGGDNVAIDGVAATDPDFDSSGDLDAIRCTGAGAPDASCLAAEDVIFRVQANSVALATDTTGGYAGSSSEGGAATTATALAANGANCAAGSYPVGVDASGAAESCVALYPAIAVKLWMPDNVFTANWGASVTNTCVCDLYPLPFTITDLDKLRMRVHTADADDHVEVGVYNEAGSVEYFQATATVTSAVSIDVTNSIASPAAMTPANYWICAARDNASPSAQFSISGSGTSLTTAQRFSQTCTNGVMPATLTAPSITFTDNVNLIWFEMEDN